MSDFKSKLNEEIEKRGLSDRAVEKNSEKSSEKSNIKKSTKIKKEKKPKVKKEKKVKAPKSTGTKTTLPFSFTSFFIAFFLGVILLVSFMAYLHINADKTATNMEAKMPTKTALVNKETSVNIEDAQPVLRMQPVISEVEDDKAPIIPKVEIEPASTKETVNTTQDEQKTVPYIGLFQNTDFGLLPIINKENGTTAFESYKKTISLDKNKPSIAFIVTNMGINTTQTKALITNLSDNITLSFSPYGADIKKLMMQARESGHETWMTLPLQTKDFPLQDPGPLAILNAANITQNQARLNTVMGKAVGYVGVTTQKDHIFRSEDARTNPIFKELFDRGLAILDSNSQSINFVSQLAERNGRPHAQNNFWLDEDLTPLALNQRLRQALEFSKNTGGVIVMLRPYPASIKTLNKFLNSVAARDFNIVPASTLVKNEG